MQRPTATSLSQSIYYGTRNLLEVMRRHGTWYHWIGIVPNFLVRWVGFLYRARVPAGPARVPPGPRQRRGRLCERPGSGAEPAAGAAAARTEAPE